MDIVAIGAWVLEQLSKPEVYGAILGLLGIKAMPDALLEKFFYSLGVATTIGGNKGIGRFWEKIENFLEHTFMICYKAFFRGANSDDPAMTKAHEG